MRCPFCSIDNDRVIDSRASQDGYAIRRRRECLSCERRYTTYERLAQGAIKVVKRDGVREPFSHDKILQGLRKACWKRPLSDDTIHGIATAVEGEVYAAFETEVDSAQIGKLVMESLAQVDQVAYVRFASVYRRFKNAQAFVDEIQPMLNENIDPDDV